MSCCLTGADLCNVRAPPEYGETHAGHCRSYWRSVLDDVLVYFFAK